MTVPRFRCGNPEIPPGGDPARVCLVCHCYISPGQGMGIGHLRTMVHKGDCDELVMELGRIYDQSPRGRWRPLHVVRGLVDGARCEACKGVAE